MTSPKISLKIHSVQIQKPLGEEAQKISRPAVSSASNWGKDGFYHSIPPQEKSLLGQMVDIVKNFVKAFEEEKQHKKQVRPRIEYRDAINKQISETQKFLTTRFAELKEMKKSIDREQKRISAQSTHYLAEERLMATEIAVVQRNLADEKKLPSNGDNLPKIRELIHQMSDLTDKQKILQEEKAAFDEDVKTFDAHIAKNYTPKMQEWVEKRKELDQLQANLSDIEAQIEELTLLGQNQN